MTVEGLKKGSCGDGSKSTVSEVADPCLPKEFPAVSSPMCPPPPTKDIYPTRDSTQPPCKPVEPAAPACGKKEKKCAELKSPSFIEKVLAAVSPSSSAIKEAITVGALPPSASGAGKSPVLQDETKVPILQGTPKTPILQAPVTKPQTVRMAANDECCVPQPKKKDQCDVPGVGSAGDADSGSGGEKIKGQHLFVRLIFYSGRVPLNPNMIMLFDGNEPPLEEGFSKEITQTLIRKINIYRKLSCLVSRSFVEKSHILLF